MSLAATQGAVPEVPAHKTRDPHAADVLIRMDAHADRNDVEAARGLLGRFLNDAGEALLLELP